MNLALNASMKQGSLLSPVSLPLPSFTPTPPPPPPPPTIVTFESRISPSILLIIVILAVIFFVSGLLHLLVRSLLRPNNREPDAMSSATALQGELQQLFHLHDAGVDQSSIDTLPVFQYRSIVGLKDPFDCAVCLCEFEADDRLRLLPKCSHAFHVQCIDTWLLSHSTCPLCRRSLLSDFAPTISCSPAFLVLETGSESSRASVSTANLGLSGENDLGTWIDETSQKAVEVAAVSASEFAEAKVVPVKLGKLRSVDVGGGEGQPTTSGNSNLDQRRCFSMVFDALRNAEFRTGDGNANLHRNESFSASKVWLRSGKDEPIAEDASRRASSFRLPLHLERDEIKVKKSHESYSDVEAGICDSHVVSRLDETPSFAKNSAVDRREQNKRESISSGAALRIHLLPWIHLRITRKNKQLMIPCHALFSCRATTFNSRNEGRGVTGDVKCCPCIDKADGYDAIARPDTNQNAARVDLLKLANKVCHAAEFCYKLVKVNNGSVSDFLLDPHRSMSNGSGNEGERRRPENTRKLNRDELKNGCWPPKPVDNITTRDVSILSWSMTKRCSEGAHMLQLWDPFPSSIIQYIIEGR
ncbi:hypothetical protein MUK42_07548 [Musa troglodytarum]|uniref:RING-type E3 ubiquitin transferase n=1 Tax=Musa troglodytarum TaxID=320322 RepID=A0A9E7I821_9LILI|nr:hypothetical protein MUK42_07548 [Musa troglodytarum]